jgi:hypothetical protein
MLKFLFVIIAKKVVLVLIRRKDDLCPLGRYRAASSCPLIALNGVERAVGLELLEIARIKRQRVC